MVALPEQLRRLLLGVTFCAAQACAQQCNEPSPDETGADLDQLYELHDFVFVARVDRVVRRGVLAAEETAENAELFVYQPPLKGEVPEQLAFDYTRPCAARFSEGAVYLLFLNDLAATPFRSEVRLLLADESGPAVPWILEWIDKRNAQDKPVAGAPPLAGLAELRWSHRVIIVEADAGSRPSFEALFELERAALEERDVVWFVLDDDDLSSNYPGALPPALAAELRDRVAAEVTLIGKDGGVKWRSGELDLDTVFALIDGMPMRRQEMREAATHRSEATLR